jgi:diaminopimelate decarboxylase
MMNGAIQVGELPLETLVRKYGEPAYFYDGDALEAQARRLKQALPPGVEVIYSVKANPSLALIELLLPHVDGLDVSSLGELMLGRKAGCESRRIYFVGPGKSVEEIRSAAEQQVGALIVESEQELNIADQAAAELGRRVRVALRVNPAFSATGSKLTMGGAPRQFGIDEEELPALLRRMHDWSHVTLCGVHGYVGTRILDWRMVLKNTEEILKIARRVTEQLGRDLEFVDFGGGIGVPYFTGETVFDLDAFGAGLEPLINEYRAQMPHTRFILEAGRYLVADCGVYVSAVRYVKTSRGVAYLMTSGGMNHHQAAAMLGSPIKHNFPVELAGRAAGEPKTAQYTICGPLCTPTDVLAKAVALPPAQVGDLVVILRSGAYCFTASPLAFLSHDWPVEALVYRGADYLIRPRKRAEELWESQISIPSIFDKERISA